MADLAVLCDRNNEFERSRGFRNGNCLVYKISLLFLSYYSRSFFLEFTFVIKINKFSQKLIPITLESD